MKHEKALAVIKDKAGSKYSGKPLQLLTMLVRGYSPRNPAYCDLVKNKPSPKHKGVFEDVYVPKDIDGEDIPALTRVAVALCAKLGGIGEDQLRKVIKSIAEIKVEKWANGRIHFRLQNLDALAKLPDFKKAIDEKHKARRAYKTERARNRRAELKKKQEQETINAVLGEVLKLTGETFFGK
jgi:hypothetical protein